MPCIVNGVVAGDASKAEYGFAGVRRPCTRRHLHPCKLFNHEVPALPCSLCSGKLLLMLTQIAFSISFCLCQHTAIWLSHLDQILSGSQQTFLRVSHVYVGYPRGNCHWHWGGLFLSRQWKAGSGFPRLLQLCQCWHPHLQRPCRPASAHLPVCYYAHQ